LNLCNELAAAAAAAAADADAAAAGDQRRCNYGVVKVLAPDSPHFRHCSFDNARSGVSGRPFGRSMNHPIRDTRARDILRGLNRHYTLAENIVKFPRAK